MRRKIWSGFIQLIMGSSGGHLRSHVNEHLASIRSEKLLVQLGEYQILLRGSLLHGARQASTEHWSALGLKVSRGSVSKEGFKSGSSACTLLTVARVIH